MPGNLYFRKGNPDKFLIFKETRTLKSLLIFQEMELFSPPQKDFVYFRRQKPRKNSYISLKIKPYFSQNKAALMFQETEAPMDFFISIDLFQ